MSGTPGAVSVIGLGKLGMSLAAVFASRGCFVIGVDVNQDTVEQLRAGGTRLIEPGLNELIGTHRQHLTAMRDCQRAVEQSDISFIVVPTPSEPDGTFSLRYVLDAAREVGRALGRKSGGHLVVLSSTVLPGSVSSRFIPVLEQESGRRCGRDFGVCYNPLFVSLGTVLNDILAPDLVLIGESDPPAGARLAGFYQSICGPQVSVARMNVINAELTKLAVNTFVTTKISFANMLAELCEWLPGADVDVVTSALGRDRRIGSKYLKGGLNYGGPCFPRDNRALQALGEEIGCPVPIAVGTDAFNRAHAEAVASTVLSRIAPGMTVGVLGAAYKPDTDVIDESPGIGLIRRFVEAGCAVIVYDRFALPRVRELFQEAITYASDPLECVRRADAVVVTYPSREFQSLTPEHFAKGGATTILVDCWRQFRGTLDQSPHIAYVPLGCSHVEEALPAVEAERA